MAGIPQGWTKEKLQNATVDDLRQLPEETLHELDTMVMHDAEAIAVVGRAQFQHNRAVKRAELGLPPAPPKGSPFDPIKERDPFVELVEREGWDVYGFGLVRVDHTNQERWDTWADAFLELLDQTIVEAAGGSKSLTDRCSVPMFEDGSIELDDFPTVQRFYKEVAREQHSDLFTAGIDHGFFLAVDKMNIDSLLEPTEGIEPWVWLIDEHFDFSTSDTLDETDYPGYFPIAVTSLITDLFPMVAGSGMSGKEVYACCAFDDAHPVWTHAFERILDGLE